LAVCLLFHSKLIDPLRKCLPLCPGRNVVSFGAAPAGYVAGRGRGVSGFGGPSESAPLPGQALVVTTAKPKGPDDEDESNFSDAKFDEFSGFSENLFSGAPYEDDDREADLIYDAIDRRMASKRKNHMYV
jgi:pre-mRNA-processing factor 6